MKNDKRPGPPVANDDQFKAGVDESLSDIKQAAVLDRIKLAFLEEFVSEKPGYDPYDTSRNRSPDVWARKPKRA